MGTSREAMRHHLAILREAAVATVCRLPLFAIWSVVAALAVSGATLIWDGAAGEPRGRVIGELAMGWALPVLVFALLTYFVLVVLRIRSRSDRASQ